MIMMYFPGVLSMLLNMPLPFNPSLGLAYFSTSLSLQVHVIIILVGLIMWLRRERMFVVYWRVLSFLEGYASKSMMITMIMIFFVFPFLITRETKPTPIKTFLQNVYENDLNEYASIHSWLDVHHPEPAWRRKRSPINLYFELKYFTVLVYLCGHGQLLMDCFRKLAGMSSSSLSSSQSSFIIFIILITITARIIHH